MIDVVVETFSALSAAEPLWRQLEASAVLTPYQRFDWVDALVTARSDSKHGSIVVAVVTHQGRPVALLPLIVERKSGMRQARIIGSDIGNSDWMMIDPKVADRFDRAMMDKVLGEIGTRAGIDLMAFSNLPGEWQGVKNPLLGPAAQPAANNLYFSVIGPTPAPYIEHRLNQKKRANLRRGARRLEEMLGPVKLVRANDAATLEFVHAAFLRQRAERFDEMGVDNIFADDDFVRFFKTLAVRSFNSPRPALVFHALCAGDEIVATSCGTTAGDHYSQYINSTTSGPASKYSLMGILMADLMDELNAMGIVSHDMGVGDFEYKRDWTEPQVIHDAVVPVTARGNLMLPLLRFATSAKRTVKQNRHLWAVAQFAMKTRYELMKRVGGGRQ